MDDQPARHDHGDGGEFPLIRDHFRTLIGNRGPLPRLIFAQIVVPIAAGVIALLASVRLTLVNELIAGASIVGGFLFALVIFVFQLRIGIRPSGETQSAARLPELIDQLFTNVLYSVVVAFGLTLAAIIASGLEPHDAKTGAALGTDPWMSAILVALGAHLVAVIGMCLRRTRSAYLALKS